MNLIIFGLISSVVGFSFAFVGLLKMDTEHRVELIRKIRPKVSCHISLINSDDESVSSVVMDGENFFEFTPPSNTKIMNFHCGAYNKED